MNKEGKIFWMILFVVATLAAAGGFFTAQYSVDSALAYNAKPLGQLMQAGESIAGQEAKPKDLRLIIFQIVQVFLGIIGTALVIVIMYAGYMWWSARGNEDRVTKAKSTIRNAIIGMIVVSMSYAMVTFVFRTLFYDKVKISNEDRWDATTDSYGEHYDQEFDWFEGGEEEEEEILK